MMVMVLPMCYCMCVFFVFVLFLVCGLFVVVCGCVFLCGLCGVFWGWVGGGGVGRELSPLIVCDIIVCDHTCQ